MAENRRCPECGAELPTDAPLGLCGACLLRLGLGRQPPTEDWPTAAQRPPSPDAFAPPDSAGRVPEVQGYEILGRLGQGGMGTVWRAVQLSTRREVALKLLGAGVFGSE